MIFAESYKRQINNAWILFATGGIVYYFSEIFFRGYSHFSMFICGGLCFYLVGLTGVKIKKTVSSRVISWLLIMILGSVIITSLEFMTGLIVNVGLDMKVWDYSYMKWNIMGQICIAYSGLWAILSILCVAMYELIYRRILA